MDPNACLQRIITAAADNDRDEYTAACEDLADWLRGGGFAPVVPKGTKYIPGIHTPWALINWPEDGVWDWYLNRYAGNVLVDSFRLKEAV